jgi:hypothetical protein
LFTRGWRAIRRESALAICHHWGITPQTVTKWWKALGIGPVTEGTHRLHSAHGRMRTRRPLEALTTRRRRVLW